MVVYVRQVGIVLGVDGVSGVQFPWNTFMHCVGRVLVALGASNMSFQLVMVYLKLFELLFMAMSHLYNTCL